ncbi:protein adenylyltransferase SelO [Andreprevotia chitinilytica]|uniref:protein adenylyltransferase SelO n=1 Tax=Andreprevotia chitinilytica TaxID=396808 RepID=UPI0005529934|nr:YdiU family protein [Andreprevotia chitinilytica]
MPHPHSIAHLPLQTRFGTLPDRFFSNVPPTPLAAPHLVAWNSELAAELGLMADASRHQHLADYLVGNLLPAGSKPIASVYCGHQFGVYVPQLGDGRAILIAETPDVHGAVQEIQLKGAGPTPYSRRADGRAVLRSSIREYLCSEAMHGLGIPTTRALGIAGSPQPVWRETMETAAVVTRVAPTFVRFGSFEYFFYQGEHELLKTVADWVIEHFYPACRDAANPYQALLESVIARTAQLIAQWQAVGFCHGVMNSDNMSILGLTLDYGPFGFLDGFDAGHICNHSDDTGRYAYNQQPQIGLFNLQCLAQALLPLLERDAAIAALHGYQSIFEQAFSEQIRRKMGLITWQEADWTLFTELLELMQAARTDWTRFWRALCDFDTSDHLRDDFLDRDAFDRWADLYHARLAQENRPPEERGVAMKAANPKYILRNHLAENAIRAAQAGDFSEIERLQRCLMRPFDDAPEFDAYAALPPSWASELSVSCSS